MANVAVIGSQWGDEGKGKIVDWLSERADIVVRFQGGHNAGHTLVIDGVEYKLSLLPSGIVGDGKLSVIGNGVVVDPAALLQEIDTLTAQSVPITPENLVVAENVNLILKVHVKTDNAREKMRGAGKIGTTGRGIGLPMKIRLRAAVSDYLTLRMKACCVNVYLRSLPIIMSGLMQQVKRLSWQRILSPSYYPCEMFCCPIASLAGVCWQKR